ncbi:MAG: integrase catalytic domain-containing protein [Bacteroidaceae bacterium]|nr:integrase catalytic domain-containing protein [Bacteroidaceae bacterium]
MIISYTIRAFIKDNGQVAVRVRSRIAKIEVTFITGVYAEPEKWDNHGQKAIAHTVHKVRSKSFSATEINSIVSEFKEAIDDTFRQYELSKSIPTNQDIKDAVNSILGRCINKEDEMPKHDKSLHDMLVEFIGVKTTRDGLSKQGVQKYNQIYTHLISANPDLTPYNITEDSLVNLRAWYIREQYKNSTAVRRYKEVRAFIKWLAAQDGVLIPKEVLNFKMQLPVVQRTVTFLKYAELKAFSEYQFKNGNPRLTLARDLWCFMAFTSLRYSDLENLKTGHISDNTIRMHTKKTKSLITIPLVDDALAILAKYKDKALADGRVFDAPSNQKLNDAIKEAACEAGLNREVIDTFFVGNDRKETQYKFHEIISCHDARRTFVCCSLAMGIPAEVVMKATGHKDYETMKPYIEVATETQAAEMGKWNRQTYKSKIIALLDTADTEQLKLLLTSLQNGSASIV